MPTYYYAVALWVAYRLRIRGNATRLRLTAVTHSHMPFDPNLDNSGCVREVIDLGVCPYKDNPLSEPTYLVQATRYRHIAKYGIRIIFWSFVAFGLSCKKDCNGKRQVSHLNYCQLDKKGINLRSI